MKKGAPISAVTIPTGIPPASRAPRSASASSAGAIQDAGRQQQPMVRADRQAQHVRHHQPDEADRARDGHDGRSRQGGEHRQDQLLALDVDAQVAGRSVAQQEQVEAAPADDEEG